MKGKWKEMLVEVVASMLVAIMVILAKEKLKANLAKQENEWWAEEKAHRNLDFLNSRQAQALRIIDEYKNQEPVFALLSRYPRAYARGTY